MVMDRSYWDVGVNVVVDFVNIAVDNVSIVDIVVAIVEIDGDNVVDSVVEVIDIILILWEDWSFEKTWLTEKW